MLERVKRVVRLGGHFGRFPRTAESRGCCFGVAADVFGKDKSPCRLVYGVTSLPLGTPVELEVIFEIAGQGHRKQYSRASAAVVGAPQQSLKLHRRIYGNEKSRTNGSDANEGRANF